MNSKQRTQLYSYLVRLPAPLKRIALEAIFTIVNMNLKKARTPLSINFFITDNCNLKCSHCFYAGHLNSDEKLSLENIEKIVNSLKNPPISVVLTGGETFLRTDILEICKMFDRIHTKKVILATNGTLPEIIYDQVKKIIAETKLDIALQLSLDGSEKIHDNIRGVPGTYKRVMLTLKKLKTIKSKRLSISLSTTVSKKNYENISALIEETRKLEVFHGLQFVRSAKKQVFNIDPTLLSDFNSKDETLTFQQMQELNKMIKTKVNNENDPLLKKTIGLINDYFIRVLKERKRFMKCTAGYADAVIYPDGGVSICEFTRPFANLKNYDWNFYKLWKSEEAEEIRKKTKNCVCTHQCNLLNSLRYDKNSIRRLFEK